MNTKIKELTENIYKEGIEKAKNEGDLLVEEARKEAEKMLSDARQKAELMVSEAKAESEKIYAAMQDELESISTQMLEITRQEVSNVVSAELGKELAAHATADPKVIHDMMLEITRTWVNPNGNGSANEALVPENLIGELEPLYKASAAKILNSGLVIKPVRGMEKGFQLLNNHEGYKVSFTEDDFQTFFESLIKPKVKELLFNS